MTVNALIRRELDKVHGATTTARLVLETIRACLRHRVTGLASEAAFFLLLSLPPLVLALFGGVGYLGQLVGRTTVDQVAASITGYAAQFLTEDSITQVLLPTVDDVLRNGRFELVSLGFLLALWSGSRALNVVVDTIAIMYGQSGVRGIVRTRALSFSLYLTTLAFGVVIIPPVLVGPTLIDGWLPDRARFLGVLYWPVVVVATLAALTTLFHVATPQRTRWWRESPGAVLALVLWVLASFVVRSTGGVSLDRPTIYGPLSAPIVVVIWLYAIVVAVLIGAGVNAATRVLWPVMVRTSPTTRLVEWAHTEMDRRRSYGGGADDAILDALLASEQQYLDLAWPALATHRPPRVEPRAEPRVEHRRAS